MFLSNILKKKKILGFEEIREMNTRTRSEPSGELPCIWPLTSPFLAVASRRELIPRSGDPSQWSTKTFHEFSIGELSKWNRFDGKSHKRATSRLSDRRKSVRAFFRSCSWRQNEELKRTKVFPLTEDETTFLLTFDVASRPRNCSLTKLLLCLQWSVIAARYPSGNRQFQRWA